MTKIITETVSPPALAGETNFPLGKSLLHPYLHSTHKANQSVIFDLSKIIEIISNGLSSNLTNLHTRDQVL